ncbi:MAG: thiol reductant ABC exporter subunit CydD [Actinomycetota bacterium]|nr:thiol reductant ABC exporter subunit CydD [Actinomycetota bacterium]
MSAGFAGAALVVVQAWLLSRVVGGVFQHHYRLAGVATLLALLLGVAAARGAALLAMEVLGQRAAARVKAGVRKRLAAHLFALGPVRIGAERTGEVASTLGEGVEALDEYVRFALPALALAVLAPALVFAVYAAIDPLSALALLVVAPFIPVLTALIGLRTRDLMDRRVAELGRMSAHFLDMIQGLPTLKMFGQSGAQVEGISRVAARYGRSTMDVLRVAFQSSLVLDLSATMGVALVAIEIGTRLLLRTLDFERALFLLLLAPEFFLPLRQLAAARHARLAATAAGERIFELLAAPVPPAGGHAGAPRRLDVRFVSVSYTPPGRSRPALANCSLWLPAGRTTALVGPSGAGKSTVGSLLQRFVEPDEGAITVGGVPLALVELRAWRRQVAVVPQRPHIFHGTIADNIRLARPEAPMADVVAAAKAAALDDFVATLPLGYETPAGEDGARLSGGQRQRVALARAFLQDRPLLLLDEPTVHLDPGLEARVRESIALLCAGRTALLITHDEALAARADRVITLPAAAGATAGAGAAT